MRAGALALRCCWPVVAPSGRESLAALSLSLHSGGMDNF